MKSRKPYLNSKEHAGTEKHYIQYIQRGENSLNTKVTKPQREVQNLTLSYKSSWHPQKKTLAFFTLPKILSFSLKKKKIAQEKHSFQRFPSQPSCNENGWKEEIDAGAPITSDSYHSLGDQYHQNANRCFQQQSSKKQEPLEAAFRKNRKTWRPSYHVMVYIVLLQINAKQCA